MRILSFSSEKRHMKHSCLHVQTREKIKQQLRFAESYNCHSLYCENCYHSIVVIVQLILPPPARFTCSLKLQSTTALYSQQSNITAYFTCSCAFAQRKTKKENEKSGEKTITEDACVSLWYLILTFDCPTQTKNISLFNIPYSFPSQTIYALPSRLLKMRPTTTARNF